MQIISWKQVDPLLFVANDSVFVMKYIICHPPKYFNLPYFFQDFTSEGQ